MGLVLWGVSQALGDMVLARGTRTLALIVVVVAGAVSYFAFAAASGAMGLAELKAILRRGRRGKG